MRKQCVPGAPSDFSSAWERGLVLAKTHPELAATWRWTFNLPSVKKLVICTLIANFPSNHL